MKFGLLKCFPLGWNSGNQEIAEVTANNLNEAIPLLQSFCPYELDENGYVKNGEITYVVAEVFGS